jgi:hypothetical protein
MSRQTDDAHGSVCLVARLSMCVDKARGCESREYADKLVASGQAYPCFCTDEELDAMRAHAEANKLPPKYTGKWSSASAEEVQEMKDKGMTPVYRFRVPVNELVTINDIVRGEVTWNTDTVGDFVLIRSNGLPVYNFCVAIDDATMRITHVRPARCACLCREGGPLAPLASHAAGGTRSHRCCARRNTYPTHCVRCWCTRRWASTRRSSAT